MNLESVRNTFNGKKVLTVIDFKTNSILNGRSYSVKYLWPSVTFGASVYMLMLSTQYVPMDALFNLSYNTGGTCRSYVYSGPTVTNNGTEQTLINKNFSTGQNISPSDIFVDPTIGNDGTVVSSALLPGGTGIASIGDSVATYEAILPGANGVSLLAKVTNVSGVTIGISVDLTLYM